MAENYLEIKTNKQITGYTVTEKVHQEKKHLVVPVIMIVEGVLNGSHGPLLHLKEDFGQIPGVWNGIPIVINHPSKDGKGISANSPEVIEAGKIGTVYNAYMDGDKLKGEAWLDENKLSTVSAKTLLTINSLLPLEISVGVYTDDEPVTGEWNGVKYSAIARNHRPDHLALLPDDVGACSLKDGCGIRSNKKGEQSVDRLEALKAVRDFNYSVTEIGINMAQGLRQKLDELYELVRTLSKPSDASGNGGTWSYLEEAYDTFLVYSVEDSEGRKYYKQNYQFNVTDGCPEFVGNPVEVEKKIEFKPVNEIGDNTSPKTIETMADKCTPCVKQLAEELITNKATKFTEDDREFLQTLEQSVLEKMVPIVAAAPTDNVLSEDDKAAMEYGKAALKAEKEKKVAHIQANTAAGTWTPDILDNMDSSMLDRIFKSVVVPKETKEVDYSLNANAGNGRSEKVKIAPMLINL